MSAASVLQVRFSLERALVLGKKERKQKRLLRRSEEVFDFLDGSAVELVFGAASPTSAARRGRCLDGDVGQATVVL